MRQMCSDLFARCCCFSCCADCGSNAEVSSEMSWMPAQINRTNEPRQDLQTGGTPKLQTATIQVPVIVLAQPSSNDLEQYEEVDIRKPSTEGSRYTDISEMIFRRNS